MPERLPSVFIALHIPKCAGSTIEGHMRKHLPAHEYWVPKKRFRRIPHLLGRRYTLPDQHQRIHARFVSGHFIGKSVEALFRPREIIRTALLREPRAFCLSYYNYRISRYLSEGKRPYDFDLHMRSQPKNPISHFILSRWLEIPWPRLMIMTDQEKYDLINSELSKFWYVGDIRQCDDLIDVLGREIGTPLAADKLNTTAVLASKTQWSSLTIDDLSAHTIAHLDRCTTLDRAIWDTWRVAGQAAADVRPAPLRDLSKFSFAASELVRPAYAAAKRFQRGWL